MAGTESLGETGSEEHVVVLASVGDKVKRIGVCRVHGGTWQHRRKPVREMFSVSWLAPAAGSLAWPVATAT